MKGTHKVGELMKLLFCLIVLPLGWLTTVKVLGVVVKDRDEIVLSDMERRRGRISLLKSSRRV